MKIIGYLWCVLITFVYFCCLLEENLKDNVFRIYIIYNNMMKHDLKLLGEALEKKMGAHKLHKMWDVLKGKEKPSKQTLDRLALLAGFQSWDDFQGALHGTEDGLVNYSVGDE